jgi:hypothetical protein
VLEEWNKILLVEGNPSDVDLAFHGLRSHRIVNPIEGVRDGDEVLAIASPMFPEPS